MRHKNPALQKIYDNVVGPAMRTIRYSSEGQVIGVDYEGNKVDVHWFERGLGGGAARISRGIDMPRDSDGVYKQSIEVGDTVRLDFINGDFRKPFVSAVFKPMDELDLKSKYGSNIPRGITFM